MAHVTEERKDLPPIHVITQVKQRTDNQPRSEALSARILSPPTSSLLILFNPTTLLMSVYQALLAAVAYVTGRRDDFWPVCTHAICSIKVSTLCFFIGSSSLNKTVSCDSVIDGAFFSHPDLH